MPLPISEIDFVYSVHSVKKKLYGCFSSQSFWNRGSYRHLNQQPAKSA